MAIPYLKAPSLFHAKPLKAGSRSHHHITQCVTPQQRSVFVRVVFQPTPCAFLPARPCVCCNPYHQSHWYVAAMNECKGDCSTGALARALTQNRKSLESVAQTYTEALAKNQVFLKKYC